MKKLLLILLIGLMSLVIGCDYLDPRIEEETVSESGLTFIDIEEISVPVAAMGVYNTLLEGFVAECVERDNWTEPILVVEHFDGDCTLEIERNYCYKEEDDCFDDCEDYKFYEGYKKCKYDCSYVTSYCMDGFYEGYIKINKDECFVPTHIEDIAKSKCTKEILVRNI